MTQSLDLTTNPAVVAHLVADENERLSFLPRFVGAKHMILFENSVYSWLEGLSKSYSGAFWNYYTLSNGGFYMSPALDKPMQMSVAGNFFNGELSADAAGIVATLFTLSHLSFDSSTEHLADHYHKLLEFVDSHAESSAIFRAID